MVVDDFDILRPSLRPSKANSKLVVDPYAVLTRTVAHEGFESVPWGNSEVAEAPRDLKLSQFAPRC